MTDPERLVELERRHEAEPGSPRVFLQLAEEYRRAGRLADAVRVLEPGLRRHPSYLSAQFALGRVRLELGEPEAASELLAEVVAKDPTHIMATKLLAEAQLRLGDAAGAGETLDRYRLLNDGDPEIAELERRVENLSVDLRPPPPPAAAVEVPKEAGGVSAPPRDGAAADRAGTGEPFATLLATGDRRRYLSALAAGGIFVPPAEPEPAVEEPPAKPEPAFETAAPAVGEEAAAEAEAPAASLGEPAPPPPPSSPAPAPAVAPASPPISPPAAAAAAPLPRRWSGEPDEATVTLGQLYLDQQHYAEAERIFRAILDREPGNAAALLGLAEVEQVRPRPLTAHDLLRWWGRVDGGGHGPRRSRAALLEAYLTRIRTRSRADVP